MSAASPARLLVDRILEGKAPLQARAAAARGALPLPPALLARLRLHLVDDPEEQIRRDAEAGLASMGDDEIRELFSDPECPPEVLDHFARSAARKEALAELLVFHAAAPEGAIALLAEKGNGAVIELVLTNQERLLSSPGLLDRLSANPSLRPDQRGKILDLLDRFLKESPGRAPEDAQAEPGDAVGDDGDAETAARLLDVDVGELITASEILGGEEFEESDDPQIRSAYHKIVTLNAAQKALLAIKGGREERSILIRDTNKIVALSVLRNPRMTDQEISGISKMRNVSDEVLRTIGSSREWTKSYAVVTSLVRNPRTPPGIATNFIPRLNNFDLKQLGKDKEVPEIVRRMAKRLHETRTERKKIFRRGR